MHIATDKNVERHSLFKWKLESINSSIASLIVTQFCAILTMCNES